MRRRRRGRAAVDGRRGRYTAWTRRQGMRAHARRGADEGAGRGAGVREGAHPWTDRGQGDTSDGRGREHVAGVRGYARTCAR